MAIPRSLPSLPTPMEANLLRDLDQIPMTMEVQVDLTWIMKIHLCFKIPLKILEQQQ
jgi:hypothetical protein